jgi:hypothetical protein
MKEKKCVREKRKEERGGREGGRESKRVKTGGEIDR